MNGDDGDDWVGILTTAAGSTLTVNGNDGDDVVEVGSNAELGGTSASRRALDEGGTVDAVDGTVTINGNAPSASDWLYVDDTGDAAPGSGETGFLTSTTITGLGMAVGITYGTVEHLEISLGDDGTQFNVLSTNAGTDTLLQTGGGDDTINVSSNAPTNTGTVDLIAGHLTIQGEGGTDTTNVSDSGDTGANTGTLTSTDLTGLDMGPLGITYATLEHLNIDLGSGGDTFTIVSTHATHTTLDTWNGTDTVNVRTIAGHTEITTGADADIVNVGSLAPAAGGTRQRHRRAARDRGRRRRRQLNVDDTGDAHRTPACSPPRHHRGPRHGASTRGHAAVGRLPRRHDHQRLRRPLHDHASAASPRRRSTSTPRSTAVRDALVAALGVTAADLDITRTLHGQELVYHDRLHRRARRRRRTRPRRRSRSTAAPSSASPENGAVASSASSMSSGRIAYLEFEDLTSASAPATTSSTCARPTPGRRRSTPAPATTRCSIETVTGTTAINGEAGNDVLVAQPAAR